MVKVSVVIPVYNVDEFLEECLDTIVNQTLDDIEIICIDDGSTDNSLEILNNYAEKDDRFIILSQKNKGHAAATNVGMELSTGKYLYLMDSDDILELSALEDTYSYAEEKNADMVLFQSMNYDNDKKEYYKSNIYSMEPVAEFIGDSVVNADDLGDLIFKIPVTPWSKLYNNSFIKNIDVKFPEGLIFDDNVFFWDVLFNANRIVFFEKYLFTRRWYSYSSTTAGDYRFIDSIAINNLIIDRFKKYGYFEKYKRILYNRKIHLTHMRFSKIKEQFKQDYFEKLHEDYKKIVSDGLYEDYMNNINQHNKNILDACLNSQTYTRFIINLNHADYSNEFRYGEFIISDDSKDFIIQTEKEIINLLDKNKKLINENCSLKDDVDNLRFDNSSLESDVDNLRSDISSLKGDVDNLKKNLSKQKDSNEKLKKEIVLFKNSNSWKLTKPLRSFGNLFR